MRKSLLEAFTSNPVSDRMDFDQTRFLVSSFYSSSNLWKKDFVFLCHRFPFLKKKSENLSPLFLKAHSTCLSKDASKEEGDGRRKVRRSGATDLRAPFLN